MILQALYNYYWNLCAYQESLDEDEGGRKIAPPGMEWKTIPYVVVIKGDGIFVRIEQTDNQFFLIPKDNARTVNVEGQILWDHCGYLLGIPKTDNDSDKKNCPEQFASFQEKIISLPETDSLRAVKLFYQKQEYLKAREDKLISEIRASKGGRITFVIEEGARTAVTCLPEVVTFVDPKNRDNNEKNGRMRCLVTGKENAPIALTHEKITVAGKNSPFIAIQKDKSFDSYGRQQGFNAPISYEASDAIGSALKELLRKDNGTSMRIGNTVYIFWSSLLDKEFIYNYQQLAFAPNGQRDEDEEEADTPQNPEEGVAKLQKAMKLYVGGQDKVIGADYSRERFFMLGLIPNSGRIAVKFWAEGTIQDMARNILMHMEDFNIVKRNGIPRKEAEPQSLNKIIYAIKPKCKKLDKMATNLLEDIVESIVKGKPYPTLVQKLCLRKNRRERNVTETRAAILKAFINRKKRYQNKGTAMQLGLDRTQTDVGYLAGRLLALYEYTQEQALGKVNTSVKDQFFSKAGVVPKAVFPKMARLYEKHIKKLQSKKYAWLDRIIWEQRHIRALFPGSQLAFPARFNLDQQNMFDNGYYHESRYLCYKDATGTQTSDEPTSDTSKTGTAEEV